MGEIINLRGLRKTVFFFNFASKLLGRGPLGTSKMEWDSEGNVTEASFVSHVRAPFNWGRLSQ